MIRNYEDVQKLSKVNIEIALESADAVNKGVQEIASEAGEFAKKSFDASTSVFEKLLAVDEVDKALEVQADYFRKSYEGYLGQAAKFGEIVADMTAKAYKPYEGYLGKLGS